MSLSASEIIEHLMAADDNSKREALRRSSKSPNPDNPIVAQEITNKVWAKIGLPARRSLVGETIRVLFCIDVIWEENVILTCNDTISGLKLSSEGPCSWQYYVRPAALGSNGVCSHVQRKCGVCWKVGRDVSLREAKSLRIGEIVNLVLRIEGIRDIAPGQYMIEWSYRKKPWWKFWGE
jgi:hypothetical protein